MNKKIIQLSDIQQHHLPVTVFADNMRSFIGWRIKNLTGGNYNHVMHITKLGVFNSQNPGGYKQIPYSAYANKQTRLKFVYYPHATQEQKDEFIKLTQERLTKIKSKGWLKNLFYGCYDYIAIVGQRLGLKWLQNPLKEFCSELEIMLINQAFELSIPKRQDPSLLNESLKKTAICQTLGYWFADD